MELFRALLGTLQQMITSAICEQLTVLTPAQVTMQPEVVVSKQAAPTLVMPRSEAVIESAQQPPA
ncbi:UNVERIFIED_CONTAM: hypothetical protein Sradi_6908400 [Sesamum radiatum]|uniref:Uncharacterized protein n=1 Tax=Sesamum radiatum TaxID=300843 RepID=A0AAW2JHD1_SESRA